MLFLISAFLLPLSASDRMSIEAEELYPETVELLNKYLVVVVVGMLCASIAPKNPCYFFTFCWIIAILFFESPIHRGIMSYSQFNRTQINE